MHKYIRFILIVPLVLSVFLVAHVIAQDGEDGCVGEDECYEEDNGGGGGESDGQSSDEDDDDSGGEGGNDDDNSGDMYQDGRLNPDNAEYYTIYCHEGTDTIYVVRVVPETETIKEIPLADAISLGVGAEMGLGDFMTMVRTSEDVITIYGSNGNLAPEVGSKSFSLSACIETNGGPPQQDNAPPPDDDNGGSAVDEADEESPEERFRRRRAEAEERLDFCYASFDFLEDQWLLVGCLNDALADYQDVLTGDEIVSLIVMVFCLNLIVGNGILPIGIIIGLGAYRRWLRGWKPPTQPT